MLDFTTIQELAIQQLATQRDEAQRAAFAYGAEHSFEDETASQLIWRAQQLEGELIDLRGQMIGTGIWTADGGGFCAEWQMGAQTGTDIYFERFENGRRTSHGFIDSESRKITQTG